MNHHDDLCVQYQYCKVGFSQSPDHKFVDCIYVLCKKAEKKISKEKKTTLCDFFTSITSLFQRFKPKRWSAEGAFEMLEHTKPLDIDTYVDPMEDEPDNNKKKNSKVLFFL